MEHRPPRPTIRRTWPTDDIATCTDAAKIVDVLIDTFRAMGIDFTQVRGHDSRARSSSGLFGAEMGHGSARHRSLRGRPRFAATVFMVTGCQQSSWRGQSIGRSERQCRDRSAGSEPRAAGRVLCRCGTSFTQRPSSDWTLDDGTGARYWTLVTDGWHSAGIGPGWPKRSVSSAPIGLRSNRDGGLASTTVTMNPGEPSSHARVNAGYLVCRRCSRRCRCAILEGVVAVFLSETRLEADRSGWPPALPIMALPPVGAYAGVGG
jgi:hypothetical protein